MKHIPYKLKPYDWQIKAIENSVGVNEYGLLAEMGTGKTGAMINILRYKYLAHKKLLRTLILTPLVTVLNWQEEFGIHSNVNPEDLVPLHKGGGKRKADIVMKAVEDKVNLSMSKPKVFILNYESLLNTDLFNILMEWRPEVLICDESHYCKNYTAKRTKKVVKLADHAIYRYIMTGTPILNSVKDIFAQFRILDRGMTFGKNQTVFMSKYLRDENATWANKPGYFPKFVAREEAFGELTGKIYKKCIRVLKKDCLDLPPLVKKRVSVEMSPEQAKCYREMERDFITFVEEKQKNTELSGAVVANLAITKALRLQQIVTGYATTEEGNDIVFEKNPRMDATKELLQNLVTDHKVIVWCSFRRNYAMLEKLCKKLGVEYVLITGDQTAEQKHGNMDQFRRSSKVRVAICNRRAAGIGINLVEASYSIVYSRNFSLGEELQSEARNYRGGSQIHESITKIDLCAKGTIDELILDALESKEDLSKRIVDIVKQIKRR